MQTAARIRIRTGMLIAAFSVFLIMGVMSGVFDRPSAVATPGVTQISSGTDQENTRENADEVSAEVLLAGLDEVRDMRVSTHGNVFLVDAGRNRLLKISGDGVRLDSLGRLGSGDYQFDIPVAIDPTNELKIYVADRNNRRIQVFDGRFQYLSTVRLPRRSGIASEYRPALLEVDAYGRLYFFDEDRHLMYRFDSHGQYELAFELFSEEERIRPVSMAILDDELWIADMRGQLLHRFSTRGSYLGFIYAPEPLQALRVFGDRIWGLGARNLMQLDSDGDIRFSMPLPDLAVTEDGPVMTDIPRWHSFDIHDNRIFLASNSMLFRWQFLRPVRELLE